MSIPAAAAIRAWTSAAARATTLAASLPIDPSAPGGRPCTRAACARCAVHCWARCQRDERGDAVADDGIGSGAGLARQLDDQVGTAGALRIPRVGPEVLVGLGARPRARPARRVRSACGAATVPNGARGRASSTRPASPPRRADDVVVRDARVGDEDLVERRMAVHLAQRPHHHAGLVHRQDEVGDPAMLGGVPVGAREEQAEARRGARSCSTASVRSRSTRRRRGRACVDRPGEVGSAAGFAEQLAPRVLAGDGSAEQEPRFTSSDPCARSVGAASLKPDAERRAHRADRRDLLRDDLVCPRRQSAAVPRRRPRRTRPTGVDQPLRHSTSEQRRIPLLGEPRARTSARTASGVAATSVSTTSAT